MRVISPKIALKLINIRSIILRNGIYGMEILFGITNIARQDPTRNFDFLTSDIVTLPSLKSANIDQSKTKQELD